MSDILFLPTYKAFVRNLADISEYWQRAFPSFDIIHGASPDFMGHREYVGLQMEAKRRGARRLVIAHAQCLPWNTEAFSSFPEEGYGEVYSDAPGCAALGSLPDQGRPLPQPPQPAMEGLIHTAGLVLVTTKVRRLDVRTFAKVSPAELASADLLRLSPTGRVAVHLLEPDDWLPIFFEELNALRISQLKASNP